MPRWSLPRSRLVAPWLEQISKISLSGLLQPITWLRTSGFCDAFLLMLKLNIQHDSSIFVWESSCWPLQHAPIHVLLASFDKWMAMLGLSVTHLQARQDMSVHQCVCHESKLPGIIIVHCISMQMTFTHCMLCASIHDYCPVPNETEGSLCHSHRGRMSCTRAQS